MLYNGRHVYFDDGQWGYDKWIYNIGLFDSVRSSAFVTMEPVKIYSQMAHLF